MADGLARAGWDLDFKHGESREIALGTVIGLSKVEVKSDGAARRTGRVFVEYEHKGEPSGLSVTEAEHWAFEIHDGTWLIVDTERLRALAAQAYKAGFSKRGGDYNQTVGVTIPIGWFHRER